MRRPLTLEGFERAEAFFDDGASVALASSGGSSSKECTWTFYIMRHYQTKRTERRSYRLTFSRARFCGAIRLVLFSRFALSRRLRIFV